MRGELQSRFAEFRALCQQADHLLNLTTSPDNFYESLVLQVVRKPSFEAYSSWMIFSDKAEQDFILKAVRWDRPFDVQRFDNPMMGLKYGWHTEPSITTHISPIAQHTIVTYLSKARAFILPEEPEQKMIVLDGTTWHVFVAGAFGDQILSWNYEPSAWKELIGWTAEIVASFEKFTPNSNYV